MSGCLTKSLMTAVAMLAVFGLLPCVAGERLPAVQFLERARRPQQRATYAMLDGVLQHRRRGGEALTVPLYFGVIIMPERTIGQLLVDGRENYLLGQSRDARNDGTSVIRSGKCVILDQVGVRASDLTMGFLYYDLDAELDDETLSAIVGCRVLRLKSPNGEELVKVYLEKENAFPLKAEFFRPGGEQPFRTVETGGFTEKNGLYYSRSLRVEGPGWRTRIEFDPSKAELGWYDINNPPRIIREAATQADGELPAGKKTNSGEKR